MQLLTVSQINAYLRQMLSADEVLRDIWVQGEISNFKRAASGHCYFSLKEQNAVLRAAMWRSYAERQTALPANGDAVLAHGSISFYEAGGDVQLYVDTIRPAGVGLLHARFEQLKQQLDAEGLFDANRKRELPFLPRRVGIVTSPQAAALRDILTVLERRCPLVEVLLSPCLVQGDQAPADIVRALNALAPAGVDVILLARGGGSIEDLWAFNEEIVARAVFACPVPVITGVGHESDTTIVDYVADERAPTPSVAAELAVPEREELYAALSSLRLYLDEAIETTIGTRRERLDDTHDCLQRYHPAARLHSARQQVDDVQRRATAQITHRLGLQRARLEGIRAHLYALSPQATLKRGYAIVRRTDDDRRIITRADQAAPGDTLTLTLYDGTLAVVVRETGEDEDRAGA
jgi:exodeoxyribonuclease VII large subunit